MGRNKSNAMLVDQIPSLESDRDTVQPWSHK